MHFHLKRSSSLVALGLLAAVTSSQAKNAKPDEFLFHNGDKPITFLGDSITEQRMYTTLIETYVLSHFPQWDITFRNVGWSGDTSYLQTRNGYENGMKRDILPLKSAAITIDFGMNDARGGEGNYKNFIDHSTMLAHDLKAAGARVALVTPSPEERYEAGQPGGSNYNNMLKHYSDGLKEVAAKEGVLFIDQYTPFVEVIEAGRKANILGATGDPRLIPDGVHPNWAGHLVMATAILKGLHAPAAVSHVELNAGTRKVAAATGCKVELMDNPAATADAPAPVLMFRRTDNALPWSIPGDAAVVLKVPGFNPLNDLSRYDLKVTGLPAAQYELWIDDKKTINYSNDDLAAGVNLTMVPGPIYDQGQKLFQAVMDKNNMFFDRWRNVQLYNPPGWLTSPDIEVQRNKELARQDAAIAAREAEIKTLRQPLPHVFKLVTAK